MCIQLEILKNKKEKMTAYSVFNEKLMKSQDVKKTESNKNLHKGIFYWNLDSLKTKASWKQPGIKNFLTVHRMTIN